MNLRNPGAVLLISTYELGHVPQGVTLAAGFLERAGYGPRGVDLSRCRLDPRLVAAARFIGVSVPMHTALRLGIEALRRIRQWNPDAFVCCYGLYAWLNAEYLLGALADAVIGGESEQALVALVGDLDAGGNGAVPGVWRPGRPAPAIMERLRYAVPSSAGLGGPGSYARLLRDGREIVAGYVETTRGCLHGCLHCPIPPVYGGRFFAIDRDVVIGSIRAQVAEGAGHVTFGDPDFLNGPMHGMRVLRTMHAEFPGLTFDITAKVEHLLRHARLLPELRELGCVFIVSAVESLSDRVLAELSKGHTQRDVQDALHAVRGAGITLRPSLLPFTPWSTLRDYEDLLDWADREELVDAIDPVQWTIRLLVPPGSALLRSEGMRPHLGELDRERLTFQWRHPDPRMDRLHGRVTGLIGKESEGGTVVDPRVVFARIRRAAGSAGGPGSGALRPATERLASRPRPPRLTEPWFC
jgi:radical SAM superfamily enzyme YgiQ (UPF0313 family)